MRITRQLLFFACLIANAHAETLSALTFQVSTVSECDRTFTRIEDASSSDISVEYDQMKLKPMGSAKFRVSIPFRIKSTKGDAEISVTMSATPDILSKPLYPDYPINIENKCDYLKSYADTVSKASGAVKTQLQKYFSKHPYFSLEQRSIRLRSSKVRPSRTLRAAADAGLTADTQLKVPTYSPSLGLDYAELEGVFVGGTRPTRKYQMVIFVDPLYEEEANELAQHKSNNEGIETLVVRVDELPGYNALDPEPLYCSREGNVFGIECYFDASKDHIYYADHEADPKAPAVPIEIVPTISGFHNQYNAGDNVQKVSYIPGLIRAKIRQMLDTHPLKYVLLMGDPDVVPPVVVNEPQWAVTSSLLTWDRPDKLEGTATDIFYALVDAPMNFTSTISRSSVQPEVRPCVRWDNVSGQNITRMAEYCDPITYPGESPVWKPEENTWGMWSPSARLVKNDINTYRLTLQPSSRILSVGRILAHNELFNQVNPQNLYYIHEKDPSVAEYVEKVKNRPANLPYHRFTSHASRCFTDNMFLRAGDVRAMGNALGINVHNCMNCDIPWGYNANVNTIVGTTTADMINEWSDRNAVMFMIFAHGAHRGIQGIESSASAVSVPNQYFIKDYKLASTNSQSPYCFDPASVSMEKLAHARDSGQGVQLVSAISCDVSNYMSHTKTELSNRFIREYGAQQWSFAEEWMRIQNFSAMTTYLNFYEGWFTSDNDFQKMVYSGLKTQIDRCGTVGDVVRDILIDQCYNMGSGYECGSHFNLFNRVFLGDPSQRVSFTGCPEKPTDAEDLTPDNAVVTGVVSGPDGDATIHENAEATSPPEDAP